MKRLIAILFTLLYVLTLSECYKILGVFPHPGKSHFDFFQPLMKALAEKGHEVTVISHFPQRTPLKGYTDISIVDGSHEIYNVINITHYRGNRKQLYMNPFVLAEMAWTSCEQGYSHKTFRDFIKSRSEFDVVLMEFFTTECYLPLAHLFKAPLIGISSCIVMPWTDLKLGYPSTTSYIPVPFIWFTDEMTFFERLENTILYVYSSVAYRLLIDIPNERAVKKYFGDDIPALQEIAANTSLILTNMHFSLTLPRPLVPGFIEVSGMNIGKPDKLPQVIL